MGAGLVGCYLGGKCAQGNAQVTFVGRPQHMTNIRERGLTLTDVEGGRFHLPGSVVRVATELNRGLKPDVVLLTVKSSATATAAAQLAKCMPSGTQVICFQNGVNNLEIARRHAPNLDIVAGMVPFNIIELGPGCFHQTTRGALWAQAGPSAARIASAFASAQMPFHVSADMKRVLWSKLLLNLNNPVGAVSGKPLLEQLLDRGYRVCLAALIDEALLAMSRSGIQPVPLTAIPLRWFPSILRLPTPLYKSFARKMLRIDPRARTSMAADLERGRPTEISELCGAVVQLAQAVGTPSPVNTSMLQIVEGWDGICLTSSDLKSALNI